MDQCRCYQLVLPIGTREKNGRYIKLTRYTGNKYSRFFYVVMLQYLCCFKQPDDFLDPPPPYERHVEEEDYLPLGVLYLCGKQRKFLPDQAVSNTPGFCILTVAPDRLMGSMGSMGTASLPWRLSSLTRASHTYKISRAPYIENKNIYTHLAIFGVECDDTDTLSLMQFYASWNRYMQFPSLDCFLTLVRRTEKRFPSSCMIVDIASSLVIAERIYYFSILETS